MRIRVEIYQCRKTRRYIDTGRNILTGRPQVTYWQASGLNELNPQPLISVGLNNATDKGNKENRKRPSTFCFLEISGSPV